MLRDLENNYFCFIFNLLCNHALLTKKKSQPYYQGCANMKRLIKSIVQPWLAMDVYCKNYSNNYKKYISNNHLFPLS